MIIFVMLIIDRLLFYHNRVLNNNVINIRINNDIEKNELDFNKYKTKYSKNSKLDSIICIICLEIIDNNYFCYKNCNHIYHDDCIKTWLNINKSCPTCRQVYP